MTILVVEDVDDNLELVRLLLEAAGYDVIGAADGHRAIALAAQARPDLILMDLSLPGLDGWEAARRIKALPALADVPVVAVTAHAMQGDRERVMAAGFTGYMTKPIDVGTFAGEVARFLPQPPH